MSIKEDTKALIEFIRKDLYQTEDFIPLHVPTFTGNEKKYLNECIDSTFVSSVGKFVSDFEDEVARYTGCKFAIATMNGTAALHVALKLVNVSPGDEVLTQSLSFVATANSIHYCGASPIFLDVDKSTLGLSPDSLETFLKNNTEVSTDENGNKICINKATNKTIKACVPVHVFGHALEIDRVVEICRRYHIPVIEDSSESLGTYYKEMHTGLYGDVGVFSFNGNKIITSGGGGVIVTNNETRAKKAKHITTTAKVPHPWEYFHDEVGYNYRLPNLNAALALGQLEQIEKFKKSKKELAASYQDKILELNSFDFFEAPHGSDSNYWLNAVSLANPDDKEYFLTEMNSNGVMARPIWVPLDRLPSFEKFEKGQSLENTKDLYSRVVNIPSTPVLNRC